MISLRAEAEWEGRLSFDLERSVQFMHMPLDWPRINQFPEWYTVGPELEYEVSLHRSESRKMDIRVYSGKELAKGLPIELAEEELLQIKVSER